MISVWKELKRTGLKSRLILQVHDELLVETYFDEVDEVKAILEKEMLGAAHLAVALEIDLHQGNNWYEAK
jgi:DNA polymerase-1